MIDEFLSGMQRVNLEEIKQLSLMERSDHKYWVHKNHLAIVFEKIKEQYCVLQIGERTIANYETIYYDTRNFELYRKHHCGKLNRYKIRLRTYKDCGLSFLEVKLRNNKGRTIKERMSFDKQDFNKIKSTKEFVLQKTGYDFNELIPVLKVDYQRICLVNFDRGERLTLDMNLRFQTAGARLVLPNVVIAESKQEKMNVSPFISAMHDLRIKEGFISKFCYGLASLEDGLRANNFKQRLRQAERYF